MLSPSGFRDLVSGKQRGLKAALLRTLLRGAEVPYTWAIQVRNRRYDRGRAAVIRVAVPVVSVGNLTLGGTGKTPLVEWIARWLREQKVRVTIVSRGYGAQLGAMNDEALELEQKLPDVPHVQNPDRVAAAQLAIEELACQAIVLDDGFQHRRLARDLDIVLVDALQPWGFGHVFPRGTLREPLRNLARADVLALTRADALASDQRRQLRDELARYAPNALWCEVIHAPRGLIDSTGAWQPVELLRDVPLGAVAGIGNPAGFRHTLDSVGYQISAFREFPDHHPYEREDIEQLANWAAQQPIEAVACTHKDLVKIGCRQLGGKPLWALAIGAEFLAGQADLIARLEPLARRAAAVEDLF